MGYRDELAAAQARAAALDRHLAESKEERAALKARIRELEKPKPKPKPKKRKSGRQSWRLWLYVGIGVAVGAIIMGIVFFLSIFGTEIEGQFESQGPPLGDWVMVPDDCDSGQRKHFYGVTLHTSEDKRLVVRVIEDAVRGTVVNVNIPGSDNRAIQFVEDKCDLLEATIERTNKSVNDITLFDGTLRIDCKTSEGRFKGDVVFKNCD